MITEKAMFCKLDEDVLLTIEEFKNDSPHLLPRAHIAKITICLQIIANYSTMIQATANEYFYPY